jgi:hypothetical protein
VAQELRKTVDFIQVAQRSVSLLASRPLFFLLISAPVLLTQLARFASGPTFIITIFVPIIVDAALFHAVYVRANGGEPDFTASYKRVRQRIGALLEYELRYFGAILLLAITIVGIPWAIRTAVQWSLGGQAVILNGESATDAIGHSRQLVKGLWWQITGAALLVFVAIGWVGSVAMFVWPRGDSGSILSAAWSLVTVPSLATFWTLVYLRLAEQDGSAPVPEAISLPGVPPAPAAP